MCRWIPNDKMFLGCVGSSCPPPNHTLLLGQVGPFMASWPNKVATETRSATNGLFTSVRNWALGWTISGCEMAPAHWWRCSKKKHPRISRARLTLTLHLLPNLYVCHALFLTSSTAQGDGGSFKKRKPIGEVGCCESRMAERSHWWTDRWLRPLLFLSFSVSFSD